ncbi:hypothetical protein [Spongiibacter marinus]|nr:hypothetical protein [Spongiibacter marinus]MBM7424982.1 hypothetical protein [Spongiibacter marinus]
MKLPKPLKNRYVVAAIVTAALSLGGASMTYAPTVTAAVCAMVGCQ